MAARRAAPVTRLARSSPWRISEIPGIGNSSNPGDAAEILGEERRDLNCFAMSAERESYATQQNLSPRKMCELKKTGGRLMFNKRPPGIMFRKQSD
jgi:hypothetical protein